MALGCSRQGQKQTPNFIDLKKKKKRHKVDYNLPKLTHLMCGYSGNYKSPNGMGPFMDKNFYRLLFLIYKYGIQK